MTTHKLLTRKDIAGILGISKDTLVRREIEWQINKCRSKASRRPFLYFESKVMRVLFERGLASERVG